MNIRDIHIGDYVKYGRLKAKVLQVKPDADIDLVIEINGKVYDAFSEEVEPINN